MAHKRIKVAVTGACGQIGYALLFRIASGQMFGPTTEIELQLIELESSLGMLQGVAMELEDCAFPLLQNIVCTSQLEVGMKDANWVILVGAVPRKQGMERSDLLKINGSIFRPQGHAIQSYASQDVRVFVVGNPCNTNCLITMQNAPEIPKDRFFAMTMLDELRAKFQLAKKAGVNVSDVSRLAIFGNHSATQFPDFDNAEIQGRPVRNVISDHAWLDGHFVRMVQQRGAEVIQVKGGSSAGSAAHAIIQSVYALTHNTAEGDFFSVAKCSEGEYGITPGLIFSFPCRTQGREVTVATGYRHSPNGLHKITLTHEELLAERDLCSRLGLLTGNPL